LKELFVDPEALTLPSELHDRLSDALSEDTLLIRYIRPIGDICG